MPDVKLFCIPYAGASANIFLRWKRLLPEWIELIPIELSGRGNRFGEPLYSSINEAVNDIFSFLQNDIDSRPYAIFGHSLGGLIAYELCHKIKNMGFPSPVHLFISGKKAPGVKADQAPISNLPEEQFLNELIKYKGAHVNVFEHEELMELFQPILRSDFRLAELYTHSDQPKLDIDMSILYGSNDDYKYYELSGWKDYTSKAFKVTILPGDHFFIIHNLKDTINIIQHTLKNYSQN
ncbi:thioesterase domain-containing protein [Paenibacillus sp. ISL-20]|uniref:thioesterase II family protein n=1 Tax=Paenibacillus sp. ISL-20 TaxID=2819163 RepID=UPI001BE7696B|nr:thioesterase [Paenibacillus sp. ISL-20]